MYNTKRQTSSKILHFWEKNMDIIAYFYAKIKRLSKQKQPFFKYSFSGGYLAKISSSFLLASSIEQLL